MLLQAVTSTTEEGFAEDPPFAPIPAPRSVLILRALKLGDMLCAVPAIRAMRQAWKEASFTLVGLPWAKDFAERFHCCFDDFLALPGFPGLPEVEPEVRAIPGFLRTVQDRRFDLAIQLHGSGPHVNELTVLFGAKRSAGFHLACGYRPDPQLFVPYRDQGLEVHRLMRILPALGINSADDALEFPIRAEDRDEARRIPARRHGFDGHPYACIHPGASVSERCWPIERFAAAASALIRTGLKVVVTGSAGERILGAELESRCGAECVSVVGETSLGSLAALIEGAEVVVCNDTGASHVAAAVRTPSVVVSTGDNPARWSPVDRDRHRVLCDDVRGVDPAEVVEEANRLLAAFGGRTSACISRRKPTARRQPSEVQ